MLDNLFAVTRFSPSALRREWLTLEDVIGCALARLEGELEGRSISITIKDQVLAHADAMLLELVLVNLIDNAIRHTLPGSPIDITARRETVLAVIEIADRGPGLAPGVFERPLGSARGLGLGVCRGIADAHGGAVVSFARSGGGSVFLITLPDGAPLPDLQL